MALLESGVVGGVGGGGGGNDFVGGGGGGVYGHNELRVILNRIEAAVVQLSSRIPANTIDVIGGLSDIDANLGLVMSGEFRAGNNLRPGNGFSGVRMGYPAFTYSSADYNIVGVNSDVIQFGLRSSDGTAVAGAGAVTINADGVIILDGTSDNNAIKWHNPSGTLIAQIWGDEIVAGSESELHLDSGILSDTGPETARTFLAANSRGGGSSNTRLMIFEIAADDTANNVQLADLRLVSGERSDISYLTIIQDNETVFNDDGSDQDFRIEGDTANNLFIADAALEAVRIGTTTAGVIADFRSSIVVINEDGANQDFRVEGDTATSLFVADAGLDAVQIGDTTAGVIADFRSSVVVFNEDGANQDFRVEGDTATQLFVADAGQDAVLIGTTTAGVIAAFGASTITFNDPGGDRDFVVETDANDNMLFVDGGNNRVEMRGAAGIAGNLRLTTAELTVVDGDRLGQLDFQAPLESDGTDAILVAASIWAEADATFTGAINTTDLVFATATSETATEKMRLNDLGRLGINTPAPDLLLHVEVASSGISPPTWTTTVDALLLETSGNAILQFHTPTTARSGIAFSDDVRNRGLMQYAHDLDSFLFYASTTSEVLRMSSASAVFNEGSEDIDFRVESNGNINMLFVNGGDNEVGIGTSDPGGFFEVFETGTGRTRGSFVVDEVGDTVYVGRLSSTGGDNTTNFVVRNRLGTVALDVNINAGTITAAIGSAGASTDVNMDGSNLLHKVTSSKRFKKFIKPLDIDFRKVYELEPRSFTWKKGIETDIENDFGLIAEEAAEVIPELVNYDEEGPYSIRTSILGVLLLAAMQDLNSRVAALET